MDIASARRGEVGHGGPPTPLIEETTMITVDDTFEASECFTRLMQDIVGPWLDSHGYLLLHPSVVKQIETITLMDGRKLDSHLNQKGTETMMTAEDIEQAEAEMQRGREICAVMAAVEAGHARELIDTIGERAANNLLHTMLRELEGPI